MREKTTVISGACPFCGGNIEADFDGEIVRDEPSLFHSLPTCDTYDRLSADEFVRAVVARQHLS